MGGRAGPLWSECSICGGVFETADVVFDDASVVSMVLCLLASGSLTDWFCATGTANAMLDSPLDGGCRIVDGVVYGCGSSVVGVDTSDTGGELIWFGVVEAFAVDETVCAALATVMSVGSVSLADMCKVVAVCVVSVVGVGTANDALGSDPDFDTVVMAVESGVVSRSTYV